MTRKKLFLITGMSGSGKTTLAEMFLEDGFTIVTMGDVIRGLAEARGLEPTPENLGRVAKGIREEGGEAAVAERCVEKINSIPEQNVVIDGIRSIREVEIFKEAYDATLVAVSASEGTRFDRLRKRNRSDDPPDLATFRVRDERELGFSLGLAIAAADFTIDNEGTPQHLRAEFQRLLKSLEGNDP